MAAHTPTPASKIMVLEFVESKSSLPHNILMIISIKMDGSFRVKSTYIKILTGVCKGCLTSPSYQRHLSTGVSPQCITADPRSVSQGTWNKHSMSARQNVSTVDCKHTAASRVLKNKTSVCLSDNNPNRKLKRYNREINK